jgi:hypothetical protein
MPGNDDTWTWERKVVTFEGHPELTCVEYRGESRAHSATITSHETPGGVRWQASIYSLGEYTPRSDYYTSPAGAKGWCERYGRPRKPRTRRGR